MTDRPAADIVVPCPHFTRRDHVGRCETPCGACFQENLNLDLANRIPMTYRAALLGGLLVFTDLASAGTPPADQPVTFAKDVAPIFQAKCETCHRPGQGAPMNLQTYAEIRPWAKSIKERVATRQMPPWHLDRTIGIQHYANDRSLSDKQIATIVKWVNEGALFGDKKDLPPARVWPDDSGWQYARIIGHEPDIVIKSAPYTVKAVGQDEWWKPVSDVP